MILFNNNKLIYLSDTIKFNSDYDYIIDDQSQIKLFSFCFYFNLNKYKQIKIVGDDRD